MASRAFEIDTAPGSPPSVEQTAAKFGVSKSALSEIKAFVAGFVGIGEGLNRRRKAAGRKMGPPRRRRNHTGGAALLRRDTRSRAQVVKKAGRKK